MRILSRFLCQDSLLQVEVSSFFIFFRKCSIPQFSTLALQFVLFLQQCIPLSVFFPILSDRWSLGLHRFKIGNQFVKSSCDILERDSGEGINHPAVVVESWTGKTFFFSPKSTIVLLVLPERWKKQTQRSVRNVSFRILRKRCFRNNIIK